MATVVAPAVAGDEEAARFPYDKRRCRTCGISLCHHVDTCPRHKFVACPECAGKSHHWTATKPDSDAFRCEHCDVEGIPCPACGGEGKITEMVRTLNADSISECACAECRGEGVIERCSS